MKKIYQCLVFVFLGLGSASAAKVCSWQDWWNGAEHCCTSRKSAANTQALFDAIEKGDEAAFLSIIEGDCLNPEATDLGRRNILDAAIWFKRTSLIKIILNKIRTKKWSRDLLEHCTFGDISFVCLEPSALHLAALSGSSSIVKDLIAVGSSVNGYDSDGETPLQYAIGIGSREIAQILLEAGAFTHHLSWIELTLLNRMLEGYSF